MPIIAFVPDLLFASKITATAEALGIQVGVLRTPESVKSNIASATALLVDLTAESVDVGELIRWAKAANPVLHVIAFGPHVQVELAEVARSAGADEVLPRSKFSNELAKILQKLTT